MSPLCAYSQIWFTIGEQCFHPDKMVGMAQEG